MSAQPAAMGLAPNLDQDWDALRAALDVEGSATLPQLLPAALCLQLRQLYGQAELFRSRVVMARHNFGRGEYQYFAAPLPALVAELRRALYQQLVPLANEWHERLGREERFPAELASFTARCHAAGQQRPTPLLLRYTKNDYNCLHQDLYGSLVFPLQVAVLLSVPGRDFAGGEFVLTEQRPRMQSRVEVVNLCEGDAVVFASNERPMQGTRGSYRVKLRHGVSRIRQGERFTLGIVFHDAT